MTALCPHCGEALTAHPTTVKSDQSNFHVLVCSRCNKFLSVLGQLGEAPGRMGEVEIVDVLGAAMVSEDPGQARTLAMIAIGQMRTLFETERPGDESVFERLFAAHMERHAQSRAEDRSRQSQAQADRDQGRPPA